MQKAKVDILVVQFCYGGNGGISMIIPEMGLWTARTLKKMEADERIGRIQPLILSDTPITMVRNRAVRIARDQGYDMILMLDSDNEPDGYLGADPSAKPFWDEAFNFAYDRLVQGIPTVIAAPYCGPPPDPVEKDNYWHGGEVPYLFEWMDNESDVPSPHRKLEMLTRNEAARLKGIYPVAALPTGVSLFTVSAFEGIKPPYFFYEFNEDHSEKHSTEDVVATRNISLYWQMEKGIDVIFAACDSWALHYKPKRVGRPRVTPVEALAKNFRESLTNDPVSVKETKRFVDYTKDLPRVGQVLTHDQNEVYISDEEMSIAEILLEREAAGVATAQQEYVPAAEASVDGVWIDEQVIDPDYATVTTANDEAHKGNGHPLTHRMICGRKIASLPDEIPEKTLDAVQALAAFAARSGPIEVAVAHAASGQAAAAILKELPEGSHLYALDSLMTYQFKTEPAMEFARSFQPELESGRVMADLGGRKFPWPGDTMHLDLVFIERSATDEKCERWLTHVQKGGILAGLGYETQHIRKFVERFSDKHGLTQKTIGDAWALVK
jgi:hypothetical protein